MERDYAKRYYTRQPKRPSKKGWKGVVLMLVLVGLVVLGFTQKKFMISFFSRHAPLKQEAKKQQQPVEASPTVHFSFYNALPHLQVEASVPSEPVVTARTGYLLQFGVFKNYSEASQLRISLLLVGIETEIEKAGQGQGTHYEVQQGPFATLSQAKLYQQKWEKKGMESQIKFSQAKGE